jgi:hypothetical protein
METEQIRPPIGVGITPDREPHDWRGIPERSVFAEWLPAPLDCHHGYARVSAGAAVRLPVVEDSYHWPILQHTDAGPSVDLTPLDFLRPHYGGGDGQWSALVRDVYGYGPAESVSAPGHEADRVWWHGRGWVWPVDPTYVPMRRAWLIALIAGLRSPTVGQCRGWLAEGDGERVTAVCAGVGLPALIAAGRGWVALDPEMGRRYTIRRLAPFHGIGSLFEGYGGGRRSTIGAMVTENDGCVVPGRSFAEIADWLSALYGPIESPPAPGWVHIPDSWPGIALVTSEAGVSFGVATGFLSEGDPITEVAARLTGSRDYSSRGGTNVAGVYRLPLSSFPGRDRGFGPYNDETYRQWRHTPRPPGLGFVGLGFGARP